MKTTGWVFTIIGILSFIGAASQGDNTFGPLFWIGLGITLIYFGTKKEETKSYSIQTSNQTVSNSQVISTQKSQYKNISTLTEKKPKSFWESYKEQNPIKAHDLEILYGESFNKLSESDIKERIRSVERAANSQECKISQLKTNVHKYFDKTIPEIGGDALREFMIQIQQKDLTEGHVKNKNSFIPKKYLQPDRYNNVDGIWEAEYTDIKGEKYFVAPKIERGREDYYDEGGTNANTPGLVVYSESGRKGVYSDADGLPFTEPTKSYVQFMLKFETRLEGYCRNAGLQYLWYHGFNECQEYWETDLENGDVLFVLKVNGQNVWTGHVQMRN